MLTRAQNRPELATSAGFTLIEVLAVLAILGGLMGAAVYGINRLSASDLRDQSMRLAATMQFTWARAATEQVNYRLVLDLDENIYWTEVSDADVVKRIELQEQFHAELEERGRLEEERQERKNARSAGASDFFGADSDPFGITRATQFQRAEDDIVDEKSFRPGIEIHQVITSRQERPITSGKIAVGFFPDGFQEPVIIVLKDEHDGYYSLINEPLTGRVKIYSELIADRDALERGEDHD